MCTLYFERHIQKCLIITNKNKMRFSHNLGTVYHWCKCATSITAKKHIICNYVCRYHKLEYPYRIFR